MPDTKLGSQGLLFLSTTRTMSSHLPLFPSRDLDHHTCMAGSSSQLYWAMTDGTANQISTLVTGKKSSPFESIDKNLAYMQLTLTIIDSLSGGQGSAQDDAKSRAMWFTGI